MTNFRTIEKELLRKSMKFGAPQSTSLRCIQMKKKSKAFTFAPVYEENHKQKQTPGLKKKTIHEQISSQ